MESLRSSEEKLQRVGGGVDRVEKVMKSFIPTGCYAMGDLACRIWEVNYVLVLLKYNHLIFF